MTSRYYDVIVIGRSLGALTAAALLARRDFTVLVVGQRRLAANYTLEGRTLRRRAFTMLAATSPVWTRIMRELAHTQTWRRQATPLDPMLQILGAASGSSKHGFRRSIRLDVPPDAARFTREIEREFPEIRRLTAELYGDFARVTEAADTCFEREAMWPPGTFFERRATQKLAAALPYARAEPHADLLGGFPRDHAYRQIVHESVRFATDLASAPPAFAVARLHGAWTRGVFALDGGEQALEELLLERVRANGGELAMGDRAVSLTVRRGVVSGVVLDGHPDGLGAGFVVTDLSGEAIANLAGGEGITKRAQRNWPRVTPSTGRFVVSMVARQAGVPAPLGQEALLLGATKTEGRPSPTIHLQRAGAAGPGEELLVAEVLVGERDISHLQELRGQVLERVCQELPFLTQHLVLVDSVHDGLPVWRYDGAIRQELERVDAKVSSRVEPMERQVEVDPSGFWGLAGEPVRGPLERTPALRTQRHAGTRTRRTLARRRERDTPRQQKRAA